MVAAKLGRPRRYRAASRVVMCSKTIFSLGRHGSGSITRSMKRASRSKDIDGRIGHLAVDQQQRSSRCIISSVAWVLRMSVTPASLLVVAPAG